MEAGELERRLYTGVRGGFGVKTGVRDGYGVKAGVGGGYGVKTNVGGGGQGMYRCERWGQREDRRERCKSRCVQV